jgi:DNA excision repair protein ERCC-4
MAKIARENKDESGPLLRKIKKEKPAYFQQLSILSSIPGIGDKLAIRILQRFKTPTRALNASIADLARVPGLGTARAVKVREILDRIVSDDSSFGGQSTLWDSEQ